MPSDETIDGGSSKKSSHFCSFFYRDRQIQPLREVGGVPNTGLLSNGGMEE
jgi:hypothetical protein